MKNIKKFNDFEQINELKWTAYRDAAEILKKKGKTKRSIALSQWSLIKNSYKFGTMNLDVMSGVTNINWKGEEVNDYRIEHFSDKYFKRSTAEFKKYKYTDIKDTTEVYFANIFTNNLENWEIDEMYDGNVSKMKEIAISVVFVDSNINLKSSTILPFHIAINIKWTTPDTFVVDNISIEHPWSEFDNRPHVFTDRRSANIFTKKILKKEFLKENCYDEFWKPLKDFFFEYSTHAEFEKALDLLGKLSHYDLSVN